MAEKSRWLDVESLPKVGAGGRKLANHDNWQVNISYCTLPKA